MMKDTFFSMPRFIALCRKDMVENWRSNLLRVALMYGVMALIMIWKVYYLYEYPINRGDDIILFYGLFFFMCALYGFGCLSASFTMEKMKSKTGCLSVLMTPATPFEKFFSRWFVSAVVFLVAFVIAYKLADYTRVLVYTIKYPENLQIVPVTLSKLIKPELAVDRSAGFYLFPSIEIFISSVAIYFFAHSFFVLGSVVWPKNAFLRTFVTGMVIVIIYALIAMGLVDLLFDKEKNYSFGEPLMFNIVSLLAIIMALVNWIIAYFRFKESEIINRM